MKKIEAYIRPEQLEDIKEALKSLNVNGISVTQIMGSGCQRGYREFVRGTEVDYNFLKKIKIELVVSDSRLEEILDKIVETAKTGQVGDGKIFISEIQDALRIRTGERGEAALR
ncbi:P-II family nitrogen regulator [Caproiciproducens sp. NJN-50]|uniref:P-II family nitrogen regulator n=1 Tax=Acutalibacteraceae TaxID=3082771 RepID=UPI000FFE332D|nr:MULTISPECIES: P-II family nitrogen regulator [Acutalibacteraceae]QAT48667.1 P-II family nitrogen regulator [Caproiciproducens sp. NJN-50]